MMGTRLGLQLFGFIWGVSMAGVGQASQPPNVLLLLLDDVGVEAFSSYTDNPANLADGEGIETPNIDSLAATGVRFLHAHSTPLCTPTRVQVLTGKYSYRNYRAFGYLDNTETTVAQVLRNHGYRTVIAGKWQLNWLGQHNSRHSDGRDQIPTGVTADVSGITPEVMRRDYGFDTYRLWYLNYTQSNKGPRYWNPKVEEPSLDGETSQLISTSSSQYGPDLYAEKIKDVISSSAADGVPFFAYYSMVLPHDPWVSTPDSAVTQKSVSDERYFDDNVEYADRILAQLLAHLDDPNGDGDFSDSVRNNTLVIFTADNGTSPNIVTSTTSGNITGGKFSPTTRGTHVPFILNWPGTLQPETSSRMVDFSDIAPTILEVAGISAPADSGFDGLPILSNDGNVQNNREVAYLYYKPLWGISLPDNVIWEFAQEDRYKLYGDGRFFDVAMDPDEQLNLAAGTLSSMQQSVRDLLQTEIDRQAGLRVLAPYFVNGATRHITDTNLDGEGDTRSSTQLYVGDNNANSQEYRVIFEAQIGAAKLANLRADYGGATLRGTVTHTRGTVPDIRVIALTEDENGDIGGSQSAAIDDFQANGTEVAVLSGLTAGEEFVVDVSDQVLADLAQEYSSFRFEAVGVDPPNTPGADQVRLGGVYGVGDGIETALRLQLSALGDINEDGFRNAADIDSFDRAVRNQELTARHDLDRDGTPGTTADRELLVEGKAGLAFGDANSDGLVDLLDFHILREQYGSNAGWQGGDFDGDGQVSALDVQYMWDTFDGSHAQGVDLDSNGREDLIDFAHLVVPANQADSLLPFFSIDEGRLQVSFRRIGSPAISYFVERSDTLQPQHWTSGAAIEAVGDAQMNADGTQSVTYRVVTPIAADPEGREFLRLRVSSE